MAVLVLEAGVGALARLYEEQVGPELKMNLNRTFLENYSVRSRETAAIDQMQKEVSTRATPEELVIRFSNWPIRGRLRLRAATTRRCRTIASEIKRAIARQRRGSSVSPRYYFYYIFRSCYIRDRRELGITFSMAFRVAMRYHRHTRYNDTGVEYLLKTFRIACRCVRNTIVVGK